MLGKYIVMGDTVFTREKSGVHLEVKIPDIMTIEGGFSDMLDYVCTRFDVKSTKELTDEQYSHGCSEYLTALITESKEFRKFIKTKYNVN